MDQQVIEKYIELHSSFFNEIKKTEIVLIQSLIEYTKNAYRPINNRLRNGLSLDTQMGKILNNIDAVFNMVEPITDTLVLYRGYRGTQSCKESVSDVAFISTTYDRKVAEYMAGRCLIIFNIPPGTKVLFLESISDSPDECEVLINRSGKFQITLVQATEGVNIVNATYIPETSVEVEPAIMGIAIQSAADDINNIQRIVSVITPEEYSDDPFGELTKAFIEVAYLQTFKVDPTENVVITIAKQLNEKYN